MAAVSADERTEPKGIEKARAGRAKGQAKARAAGDAAEQKLDAVAPGQPAAPAPK